MVLFCKHIQAIFDVVIIVNRLAFLIRIVHLGTANLAEIRNTTAIYYYN